MLQIQRVLCTVFLSYVTHLGLTLDQQGNSTTKKHQETRRRLIETTSIDVRPGVAANPDSAEGAKVDVIQVGILCQRIFAIDVAGGTYGADVILTLRWTDKRVADLIPEGGDLDHLTLSQDAADHDIWVPNVVPTNRDIKGLEDISQATVITKQGAVERTRRMQVRMRQPYNLAAYPWDTQTLTVVVASSRYMFDEVEMAVIDDIRYKGVSQVVTGTEPWNFLAWHTHVVNETTGSLRKSRCILEIHIQRKSNSVVQGTVMPEMLLVVISWAVFWLPMMITFVVPRVTTCLVCWLTMATMSAKTNASLPDTGDLTWIHMWEQACSYLLFLSAVFNATAEVIYTRFDMKPFAERLRFEMSVGFAALAVFFAFLCHSDSGKDAEKIGRTCSILVILVALSLCVFIGRGAFVVGRAQREKQ